jgi:hypothetical protein
MGVYPPWFFVIARFPWDLQVLVAVGRFDVTPAGRKSCPGIGLPGVTLTPVHKLPFTIALALHEGGQKRDWIAPN